MSYIIVFRNSHREPFIDTDSHGFKEDYYSYEEAKTAAEKIVSAENESSKSEFYFDYKIYEEATS